MVENQMTSKDLTIIDIFRIIRKKAKLIAWIALIALILGAAGGTAWAFISNATYGTQAEFYIYSEGENGYILSLLRSDSFAERLLLDENGLPADKKGTEAYASAVAAKALVDAKLDEINELEKKMLIFPTELSNLQRASNDAQSKYTEVYNHLVLYKNALSDTVYDKAAHNETIATLEAELTKVNEAKSAAKKAYDDKLLESQLAEVSLLDLQDELGEFSSAKKKAYDVALSDFRKNEDNIRKIQTIKKSVTFEYEKTAKDSETSDSQSHLYVNIAVQFNKQLAQELLDSISTKLTPFVEESVIAEAEERETECVFLSVFGSVDSVDYKTPWVQAILFAAIAAVAAVVLTCVVVVIAYVVKENGESAPEEIIPEVEAADEHPALEENTEE